MAESKTKTLLVRAEAPVLGMLRGATAELTDSPYLQLVLGQGWLTRVPKKAGADPEPLSDASRASAHELEQAAAAADEAASPASAAASSAGSGK